MLQPWLQAVRDGATELPIIVPLVVYHGRAEWTAPRAFEKLFVDVPPVFQRFVPKFEYHLLDLSTKLDEELPPPGLVRAGVATLKWVFHPDVAIRLPTVLKDLAWTNREMLEFVETVFRYLAMAGRLKEQDVTNILRETAIQSGEPVETFIDRWTREWFSQGREEGRAAGRQEGRQEGRAAGEQEGRARAARMIAESILQRRFGAQFNAAAWSERFSRLTSLKLEQLAVAALDFQSIADLHMWCDQAPAEPVEKDRTK